MTNKLFIVKYVLFNVDFCEKVNKVESEIYAILKNSSIESDKREDFDDIIDFNVIFAQNINFFDVSKNVANKINSIKINKIDSIKINKIMKKVDEKVSDEVKDCLENEINSLNNANSLNINETILFNVEILKKVDLNFF